MGFNSGFKGLTPSLCLLSVVLKAQGQLCFYFDRNCKCLVNSFLMKMFRSNEDAVQSALLLVIIYLLTAVGLSPGGSTHLHTNST